MMDLASKGHIKPIAPVTVFPFEDIVSAFIYMRGGNHLGKVVISNGTTSIANVPVGFTPFNRRTCANPCRSAQECQRSPCEPMVRISL